jgi:hypothetical protein
MSKARDLGDLLDTGGDVKSISLDNIDITTKVDKVSWQHNAGTVGTFNETASIGSISIGALSGIDGSTMTASSSDLPSGLSLSSAGALTGTLPNITATTTSTFNVSVTDGTNNGTREFTVTNTADNDAPTWNTSSGALTAADAAAYSVQLSATDPEGGSLTYSITSGLLPTSLSLSSSGLISGTPSVAGTYNFTISVTDGTTPVSRSFSIVVTFYVPMVATGGSITTSGDYKIHTFNSSSTFNVTQIGDVSTVEYLVIAAGASGGTGNGGGGGAGGYRTASSFSVSQTGYSITVGAGGAGVGGGAYTALFGNNGSNSVFSSITSIGGGRGGGGSSTSCSIGGSGGGAGTLAVSSGCAGTSGQGNSGGNSAGAPVHPGGGGGGAGASGANGSGSNGGAGGSGSASSITGSSIARAGGGGGAVSTNPGTRSSGGSGGGGEGGISGNGGGGTGTTNTGSAGGGGQNSFSGSGGSGVVIIRYQFQQ